MDETNYGIDWHFLLCNLDLRLRGYVDRMQITKERAVVLMGLIYHTTKVILRRVKDDCPLECDDRTKRIER